MTEPLNFIEKLMQARRRAQLVGRPLTSGETRGIVSGVAEEATNRLYKTKMLALQEKELSERAKSAHEARQAAAKEGTMASVAGGAALGYVIGGEIGSIGGPWGAAIGAGIGFIADKACIIISACTDPRSYEVEISRQYRDKYMNKLELVGYYWLAYHIEPLILDHPKFKAFVKKWLVDRLVDYGEVILGKKTKRAFATSYPITKLFLGACRFMGKVALSILRRIENGSSIFTIS